MFTYVNAPSNQEYTSTCRNKLRCNAVEEMNLKSDWRRTREHFVILFNLLGSLYHQHSNLFQAFLVNLHLS